jgi:hypothetical protein
VPKRMVRNSGGVLFEEEKAAARRSTLSRMITTFTDGNSGSTRGISGQAIHAQLNELEIY